jgi:hypothetical protein
MTREKVEWLKRELAVLASDAETQIQHLIRLNVSEYVDELALSYDAIAAATKDMMQRGEINTGQFECATELNTLLDKMSGQANALDGRSVAFL